MGHISLFQSTLLQGERHAATSKDFFEIFVFQSTLPRGERRCCCSCAPNCSRISILAPARGATDTEQIVIDTESISTHAPTWGATEKYNLTVKQITNVLKDEPSANQMTFEDYLKSCQD
jgi:hypothetical protein